jgi:diguanylate cyclase (GGDEF)-like protein
MTGIEVPLEVAAMLCAGCAAVGLWTGRVRANSRSGPRPDGLAERLGELLKAEAQTNTIDLAVRRDSLRAGSRAVLQGRIDQLGAAAGTWNSDARNEVREHVAAVMRAGLRRDDRVALVAGDGFTISMPGLDERAAVRVADRLRRKLAQLRLPHLASEAQLTASIGVAAERFGDGNDTIARRAHSALDAAIAKGIDHVVPASEIEEIMLLPAPTPSPLSGSEPSASAA